MSFWNDIIGVLRNPRTAPDPNEALRNSIFGNATATMPMPQYDDDLRRVQRRLYDMPQLHIAGPEIPTSLPGVPGFLTPDPGYGRGLPPMDDTDMGFYNEVLQHMQNLYQGGP